MAMVTVDALGHRLPSTRPIDQRWDRSRGILFSNAKRAPMWDSTWTPGSPIVFGALPATTRSYAVRSLDTNSTNRRPPPPPASPASSRSLDTKPTNKKSSQPATFAPRSNSGNPSNVAGSIPMEKIQSWRDRIHELESENLRLESIIQTREKIDEPWEHRVQKLESEHAAKIDTMNKANQRSLAQVRQLQEELEQGMLQLQRERERGERQERVLAEVREASSPERRENEKVLEAARQRGIERGIVVAKAEAKPEISRLNSEVKALLKNEGKLKVSIADLEDQLVRKEDEVQLKIRRRVFREEFLSDVMVINREQGYELAGRRARGDKDRSDYSSYQGLFSDSFSAVFDLWDGMQETGKFLKIESRMWKESAEAFQSSDHLKLFRQSDRYHHLRQAISGFIQERVDTTDARVETFLEHFWQIRAARDEMRRTGHRSRSFTKLLHFSEVQTAAASMELLQMVGTLDPLDKRRSEVARALDRIKRGLDVDEQSRPHNQEQLVRLERELVLWNRLFMVQTTVIYLDYLRALLDGSHVEKQVFLRSLDKASRLDKTLTKYRQVTEGQDMSLSQRSRTIRMAFFAKQKTTRNALDQLQSDIRKQCILKEVLGKVDAEERKKADEDIKRLITSEEDDLENSLNVLRRRFGELSLRPVTARRHSLPQGSLEKSSPRPLIPRRHSVPQGSQDATQSSELREARVVRSTRMRGRLSKAKSAYRSGSLNFKPTGSKNACHSTSWHEKRYFHARPLRQDSDTTLGTSGASEEDPDMLFIDAVPTTSFSHVPAHAGSIDAMTMTNSDNNMTTRTLHCSGEHGSPADMSVAWPRGIGPSDSMNEKAEDWEGPHTMTSPNSMTTQEQTVSRKAEDVATETSSSVEVAENIPSTNLTYRIPPEDYRAAAMSSPNSNAAYWSHKLYKGETGSTPGVLYCTNFETSEARAKLFLDESVVGFDLEWEPAASTKTHSIKKCVSLIQVAAEDKIGLFHLGMFTGDKAENLMPPSLRKILESPNITKAGVNVRGDANRLRKMLNIEMQGLFELSHLYRVVKYSEAHPREVNFKLKSLADQVHDVLMLPLKKDATRVSSWSKKLNAEQTNYAASDAYAGFQLYHKLNTQRKAMDPTPPLPAYLETDKPLILGDGTKVVKYQRKPPDTQKSTKKIAVATEAIIEAEDGEESEEFFDAVEELDADELTSSAPFDPTSAVSPLHTESSDITYPALPLEQEASETTTAIEPPASVLENPSATSSATTATSSRAVRPDTPEGRKADAWVSHLTGSLPADYKLVAREGELRAYHLWHEQAFGVREVAALMKDPPLTTTTVASYVMQSLKEENLPFDSERLDELLAEIPKSVHGRYRKVIERT